MGIRDRMKSPGKIGAYTRTRIIRYICDSIELFSGPHLFILLCNRELTYSVMLIRFPNQTWDFRISQIQLMQDCYA